MRRTDEIQRYKKGDIGIELSDGMKFARRHTLLNNDMLPRASTFIVDGPVMTTSVTKVKAIMTQTM